mgnify:CR=1 FL=1
MQIQFLQSLELIIFELMSHSNVELQLKTLPNTPGVYQFYDVTGVVIYVGKAKNLKKRLTIQITLGLKIF